MRTFREHGVLKGLALWGLAILITGTAIWYFAFQGKPTKVDCYGDGSSLPYSMCANENNH